MPRNPKIRITKNDKVEYQRLVKNTKAKIRRIKKNHNIDVSNRIEIPSLQDFKYRKDFNQFKENMRSFTNRGNREFQYKKNKYGVSASVRELQRLEKMTKKAQELTREFIDKMKDDPYYYKGKQVGTVGERIRMMGEGEATGINVPNDFDFDKIQTRERLESKMRNMARKAKLETYNELKDTMKENYIKTLELSLNSEGDELVDMIKNMSSEAFYQMYMQLDELDFNLYDSEREEYLGSGSIDDHVGQVKTAMEKFKKEHGDNDLDTFP